MNSHPHDKPSTPSRCQTLRQLINSVNRQFPPPARRICKPGKNPPHEVNVIIEVPIGGEPIKVEMNKEAGTLFVDRMLYTSMRYPGNYGFIPHTLSGDGDPVDVLVANSRPLLPGSYIAVRPVGVLIMEDEAGQDEKIIAVPTDKITAKFRSVKNYTDLARMICKQIEHFFEHYKDLEEGKWVASRATLPRNLAP